MKYIIISLSLLLFILLIFGCRKQQPAYSEEWEIELPETKPPESVKQWGVLLYESLILRDGPDEYAAKTHFFRETEKGVIVEIIKRDNKLINFDGTYDYWYYVDYEGELGWIYGQYIHIYNNYEQAVKRSEKILFNISEE